ncbi:hypothetical protein KEX41_28750 (plasmid) [Burkholderia thailandensis]|uniref:hypothetical protein n=1 Tax=Burkholderia thailandensis TaxID=57975 RepID=UPI00192DFFBD|nr:hypothetical protein [Burkholderia thailandensis]MBS2132177.1 hypothetical protein [Burkholderia thailandensis]QRA15277.1 hypothetical protein JMY07_29175 [Burkholderia thailandensis]
MMLGVAALTIAQAASASPSGTSWRMVSSYGMGPGSMGPGMMEDYANGPVDSSWKGGSLRYDQVQAFIRDGNRDGKVDVKSNTIVYGTPEVTINMIAVQPGHDDQTFEVRGLTDPTLTLPVGTVIHLNLVNMDFGDNMEHGLIVTTSPPPYPYMSTMAIGSGLARVMPLLPWRSEKALQQATYAELSTTFVARERGTYWYVCPTPQHAQEGMFGKFVVR